MGINRITSGFLTRQAINYLHSNLGIVSGIQERLSSGRNINRPSDEPVGLTRILHLSNTIKADERYAKNIADALAEAKTLDTALGNVEDLIHRAQELTTQAANFSNNQDGRDAIKLEIDQIINQLVQIGNTNIGGKYIFGGMATNTPPYVRAIDNIFYSGTDFIHNWQRPVEISEGVQINVNLNGVEVLGREAVALGGTPPTFTPGSTGLFRTLMELKLNLEDPASPIQQDEIRARIDDLSADLTNVLAHHSRVGSNINRLELTQSRLEERKAILTQQYANIQDIDMAATVADLNHQDNIFQASLAVTARVVQTSLLNYLR